MRALVSSLRQHVAALRLLVVFTVLLGVAYPLAVTAVAQVPGLQSRADGSLITSNGKLVGSGLIGQNFTDSKGHFLAQYFQGRPSAAGGSGYDPTASGASNLGPESVVDTLPDPKDPTDDPGKLSLLTTVCSRSLAVANLERVSGARPFCTATGVGAVLGVFWSGPGYAGHVTRVVSLDQLCPAAPFLTSYDGVKVECASYGHDYSAAQVVPVRGDAPSHPVVPADAVTASGSGLDPEISPAYAKLQEPRIARVRHATVAQIAAEVQKYTAGRDLGFIGEPRVNVLRLNLDLDRRYPLR